VRVDVTDDENEADKKRWKVCSKNKKKHKYSSYCWERADST